MKSRLIKTKKPFEWDDYVLPALPDVTKSEELRKETNFVDLPDDTQVYFSITIFYQENKIT